MVSKSLQLLIICACLATIYCQANDCAVFYSECNFKGKSASLCADTPVFKVPFIVKSYTIPEGAQLQVFEDTYYKGSKIDYSKTQSCLEKGIRFGSKYAYKDLKSRNEFFDSIGLSFAGSKRLETGYYEQLSNMSHEIFFKTNNKNAGLFEIQSLDPARGCTGNDRHIILVDGQVRTRVWNNEVLTTKDLTLADGQWHQIVHVFGHNVGQQIYVDGELAAQGHKGFSDFFWHNFLEVGKSGDMATNLVGFISEVRVWKKALTAAEVKQGMTESPEDRIRDIKLWWRMDNFENGRVKGLDGQFIGTLI